MAIETETFHLVEGGRFRQRRPSNAGRSGTCSIVSKPKYNIRCAIPVQVKVRLSGRQKKNKQEEICKTTIKGGLGRRKNAVFGRR